ncbi:sulfatase (macronuclear) [Tetrahymena thermophila SB210]|uniref:Sulfatase n=1 Tax=Tetrahymena thermophila (strain SB210) TaxID=312017 RepID=Q24BX4_TETTS|nr:sulfatase [Tetrahymena thermophila SB210]EAS05263.2 sulfatase [Tetrahymena thermophila SB210]|eukprot:XP_001025508.2 sulfatase [Tetrahymena thermophila SB210]
MKDKTYSIRLVIIPFLLLIVLALGSSILLVLFYDRYFSGFMLENKNTFCQDYYDSFIKDKKENEVDKQSLNYLICHHSMKKKHFIWFNMDGFSYDQIKQLKAEISNDILIYKSVGPHYRQTGAIHETYMTGKPSLNLIGGQVSVDNIAIQIAKAKEYENQQKVWLLGSKFPIFTLISSYVDYSKVDSEDGMLKLICKNQTDSSQASFVFDGRFDMEKFDVRTGVRFNRTYFEEYLEKEIPTYLPQDDFNKKILDCLTTGPLVNKDLTPNHSIIYYSSQTDSLNHAYSKSHSYNFFQFFQLNKLFIQLIKYFQANLKDTVIFISSDHGGQFFNGEDNFCNHGCVNGSNHGILLVASSDTVGKGHEAEISYLDLMPTIAQYMKGVNLPLFNRGVSHPFQKGVFEYEILALHSKFIQLREALKKIDQVKLKDELDMESKYNDIMKEKDLKNEKQRQILEDYRNTIKILQKQALESELSKKDFKLVNLIILLCLIGLIYIVAVNYKTALEQWKQLQLMQKVLIGIICIFYYSENIFVFSISNIGLDFYSNAFYVNIACIVLFIIFFSFYDFTSKTIPQMQLSFHKSDIRHEDDYESQHLQQKSTLPQYQQVPGGKNETLDMFSQENENRFNIRQIFKKIKHLPFLLSNKISQFLTLQRCLVLILIYYIIFLVLIKYDSFVYTKQFFMETTTKWDSFNLFNYTIFILFYFYPKVKSMQINWLLTVYYFFLFVIMIKYDLIDLRYLIHKTTDQVFWCRFITGYTIAGMIYNFVRGYKLLRKDREEQSNQKLSIFQNSTVRDTNSPAYNAKKKFFLFLHLDLTIFVFWVSDEVERLYLIIFYFTLIVIINKMNLIFNIVQAQNNKGLLNDFIINFFFIVIIFKNAQIIYSAFKGTLSLDINLYSGNKTIGEFQDQTPICTAILFGIDKLLIMIFSYMDIIQKFLRVSIKEYAIKFDNSSKGLLAIMFIKILISGIQTCYNFFDETSFLSLFLWFASISAVIIFSILPYAVFKLILSIISLPLKLSFQKQSHHLSV